MHLDTKTVYDVYDFDLWVNRSGLLQQEAYLITQYLSNKNATTLEAGTGGGRIAYALEEQGYTDITAFDFVDRFIEAAKNKNPISKINFVVADATDLHLFQNNTFEQIIYLQQIISVIPAPLIKTALMEAKRILKDDGIAVFSFLNWNGRSYNTILSILTNFSRWLRREPILKQQLPLLKLGGRFNWKFFNSHQSTNHWFYKEEIKDLLEHLGFTILDIKTSSDFVQSTSEGMLYFVCQKKS
jgi:ubiquinone/menaquinone biosynthesis C-methylase UbiE